MSRRVRMETSHYRREYAAYRSAREGALYDSYTGASPEPHDDERARERFADLWSRDSIAELEGAREEAPAQFETERTGLAALADATRLAYAEERARVVTEELSRCEAASSVEWGGDRLRVEEAPARIAAETDAARRRELAARWLDSVRACDDLRAAHLGALQEAARELGFETYAALHAQATNTDPAKLLAAADLLIERTESVYESRLAAWSAHHLTPDAARQHDFADELFFTHLADLDQFFPARDARATYEATLNGLGVRVGLLASLRVEESAKVAAGDARCFGVKPPEDVRLVFNARVGADFHRKFFYEGGRAQHFVWTSRDLASRHPEFVFAPDRATGAGFGFLFRALFADRAWLAESRGVRPSEAEEIARSCALAELHDARRTCALAREEFELLASDDPRSENLAAKCAERRREATGFRQPTAPCLFDLPCSGRAGAAELLRGRLFAASLGEHLRSRHGVRWWSRRAAGDELIDLWNAGSRYTVEELAPLAFAGALDAELLSASLNAVAGGRD
jgi:hypothetical protein